MKSTQKQYSVIVTRQTTDLTLNELCDLGQIP